MTREQAIEYLNYQNERFFGGQSEVLKMVISALSEKKCGKWKRTYLDHVAMGERPSILYCSVCCQCIAYPTNYCPNCGADMRGEENDGKRI